MRAFRFLSVLMMFCVCASPVQAQSGLKSTEPYDFIEPRGVDFTARPYYDMLVRQLIDSGGQGVNFGFLRGRYAMIDEYDPLGENAKDEILNRAFVVQTSEDPKAVEKALNEYEALVREHMANITVINQVISLAEQDKRLGDPAFYRKVQKGLMDNVRRSGTGLSLIHAYDVYVMGEEAMLLAGLNVDVLHTDLNHEGSTYYNMHSVVDRKTQRPYTIFVNITKPMTFLRQKELQRERSLDLRKR